MSSLGARQLPGKGMAQILALPLGWGRGSSLKVSEPQFHTCKMGVRPLTLEYFVRIRGWGALSGRPIIHSENSGFFSSSVSGHIYSTDVTNTHVQG